MDPLGANLHISTWLELIVEYLDMYVLNQTLILGVVYDNWKLAYRYRLPAIVHLSWSSSDLINTGEITQHMGEV